MDQQTTPPSARPPGAPRLLTTQESSTLGGVALLLGIGSGYAQFISSKVHGWVWLIVICAGLTAVTVGVIIVVKRVRRVSLWLAFIVAAVAALVGAGAGFLLRGANDSDKTLHPGPSSATPSTPSPSSSSPPTPLPSILSVSCTVPSDAKPGQIISMYYVIKSPKQDVVGFGAAIRPPGASEEDDESQGEGDKSAFPIEHGDNPGTRQVTFPDGLKPGRYEISAELYPKNMIGQTEALADAPCGSVTVR